MKMKKILSILLAASMTLSALPLFSAVSAAEGDDMPIDVIGGLVPQVTGTSKTMTDAGANTGTGYLRVDTRQKSNNRGGVYYYMNLTDAQKTLVKDNGNVYISFDARVPVETNGTMKLNLRSKVTNNRWKAIDTGNYYAQLTDTWANYTLTPANLSEIYDGTEWFEIYGYQAPADKYDTFPYDIDNFKVYTVAKNSETGEETTTVLAEYSFTGLSKDASGIITDGKGGGYFKETCANADVVSPEANWTRVVGNGSNPISITFDLTDNTPSIGQYTLGGYLRFAYYDCTNDSSVAVDGAVYNISVLLEDGSEIDLDNGTLGDNTVTVGSYDATPIDPWHEVSAEVSLRSAPAALVIEVADSSALAIDYKNISFVCEGGPEPIVGAGTGILADIQPTFAGTAANMTDAGVNTGANYLRVHGRNRADNRGGVYYYFSFDGAEKELINTNGNLYVDLDVRTPVVHNITDYGFLNLRNDRTASDNQRWDTVPGNSNYFKPTGEWTTYTLKPADISAVTKDGAFLEIFGLAALPDANNANYIAYADGFPFDIDNFIVYTVDAGGNRTEIDAYNFANGYAEEGHGYFTKANATVEVTTVEENWTRVTGNGNNDISVTYDLGNETESGVYTFDADLRFAFYDWARANYISETKYTITAELADGSSVKLASGTLGDESEAEDSGFTPNAEWGCSTYYDPWESISAEANLKSAPVSLSVTFADSEELAIDMKNFAFERIGDYETDYVAESVDFEVVINSEYVNVGETFTAEIYAVNTAEKPQQIESFNFKLNATDGAGNDTLVYQNIALAGDFKLEYFVEDTANGAVAYAEDYANGVEAITLAPGESILVATATYAAKMKTGWSDPAEITPVVNLMDADISLIGDEDGYGYEPEITTADIRVYNLILTVTSENAVRKDGSTFAGDKVYAKYGEPTLYTGGPRTDEYVYTDYFAPAEGYKFTGKFTLDGEEFVLGEDAFTKRGSIKVLTEEIKTVYGDMDGDGSADLKDAVKLAKAIAKWSGFSIPEDTTALDLNLDGKVNSIDLICLVRHLAGWPDYKELPIKK